MPMWPVHTWLPDAHVQAPTAGSVILAGVLLKMGGYGFIRFSLPMFPEASAQIRALIFGCRWWRWSTPAVALVQHDMKKLIAYSSVAHMAIVTVGLFAFNVQGLEGSMIVMLSHGLVAGALFLCVGVIYDRLHTREIDRYGGLSINMPKYALFFMLFTMASVGLPGTSGFVGEFLSLRASTRCRPGSRWSAPPGSSLARPTCSTSTAALPLANRRTPMPPPCPISTSANGDDGAACSCRAVDGRLSGKLPCADAQRYRRARRPPRHGQSRMAMRC
jgi:proton-translocating NADH-quinone oxidoreductase chain M